MTDWTTFAAVVGVVLAVLLVLTRRSADLLRAPNSGRDVDTDRFDQSGHDAEGHSDDAEAASGFAADEWVWGAGNDDRQPESAGSTEPAESVERSEQADAAPSTTPGASRAGVGALSTAAVYANVVVSNGLFGSVVAAAAWWTAVPPSALGLSPVASPELLLVGVAVGAALAAGNEVAGRVATRFGVRPDESLRAAMTPERAVGWAALLLVVLPSVAVFEEFLFRAVLVGALSAGFGVPTWLLVAGSAAAFAAGHGAQGRAGIVVTGLLGVALGAAYVATGSLFAVAVAHYVVNAAEFVVHEALAPGE
ncbi:CPBP family intramembrane glutamic endopeptidase [Halobaculum sp. P14]|uniref:CPBP family intramembrane glutamic endopeptidase n=1 Tax=Halobaculum sp. P14 TaxID=3421638 RepID=UPI003EB989F6